MSEPRETFLSACLAGRAFAREIDDYVEHWHEGDGEGRTLATYLGMTPEEYALWAERSSALGIILYARRFKLSLASVLSAQGEAAVAARAATPEELAELRRWLQQTGRL